jgi:hypothetical protein
VRATKPSSVLASAEPLKTRHKTTGTRVKGETMRIAHAIARVRATLFALEKAMDSDYAPGPDVVQAIAYSATDLAVLVARLWAYTNAEADILQASEHRAARSSKCGTRKEVA